MAAAMLAASVGLTSCKKDDDGMDPAKSDLQGTWLSVNPDNNTLMMSLTFSYSGKDVMAHIEGGWFDCTVERTPESMTLTGRQVRMATFTDYGNYLAKVVKPGVTITFDYAKNGDQLEVSNVRMTPEIITQFNPRYTLKFDKVYSGQAGVITF